MDLGVSSPQLDDADRGFSFQKDGPLDMRMNQMQSLDAKFVINNYSEENLVKIFKEYGEERFAKKIVKLIFKHKEFKEIETTRELADIAKQAIPAKFHKKNPATKIFQAIRIEVNNELKQLEESLPLLFDSLEVGGRLSVLTFHSLEDRIVKNFFKKVCTSSGAKIPKNIPIKENEIKKNIYAKNILSESAKVDEIEKNSRSRSARLRVVEKINET